MLICSSVYKKNVFYQSDKTQGWNHIPHLVQQPDTFLNSSTEANCAQI